MIMHHVLQHILKRRNKEVPINDGRKIALILPGGIVAGARGAGALMALEQMGLSGSFDLIYSSSAGFPNACYFLTGDCTRGSYLYYQGLAGKTFINFLRFWRIADVNYLIYLLKKVQPAEEKQIWASKTKLYFRLQNIRTKKAVYKEIHSFKQSQYYTLIKAALHIPFLQPGSVKIGRDNYKDGDWRENIIEEHIRRAFQDGATDILLLHNHARNKESPKRESANQICEIYPPDKFKLSRFETRSKYIKKGVQEMGQKVLKNFGIKKKLYFILDPNKQDMIKAYKRTINYLIS